MKIKNCIGLVAGLYLIGSVTTLNAQSLPESIILKPISGGTFTMGSNDLMGSPDQQIAAPEHEVTLSPFKMSEAEITNAQYIVFLNEAFAAGLIEVVTGTMGPDLGKQLVQGSSESLYNGKVLYSLDGTRVLKDHDNADGDGNEFTGVIEPENPLNVSYIGFNEEIESFYLKDPHNVSDFDWVEICNYQDYSTTPHVPEGPVLNDFEDWSGGGAGFSDELEGWSTEDPLAAVNLPGVDEVGGWPVTFIRWWGAWAFADFYGASLPTEAQWEFAAKGGADFEYAVHDGVDIEEANWNQLGMGTVALGHVRAAISGTANPYGLYNLAGNSWEWIADNYVAPYDLEAVLDPLIEEEGSTTRCWRGGAWNYHQATLQSSIRFYDEENRGNDHFGFRIVTESTATGNIVDPYLNELIIYPNPASDLITISVPLSDDGLIEYTLTGLDGKMALQGHINRGEKLDVSTLKSGKYICVIRCGSHEVSRGLIIR